MIRRRAFQRRACIISVMAAFSLGLILGVFLPMLGLGTRMLTDIHIEPNNTLTMDRPTSHHYKDMPDIHFPTIYDIQNNEKRNDKNSYAVSFVPEEKLSAEVVIKNAFHLNDHKNANAMTVKKSDVKDGSIKEFAVQRSTDGLFRKSPEVRISKPFLSHDENYASVEFVQQQGIPSGDPHGIVADNIYWSDKIEKSLPQGFNKQQTDEWNEYVTTAAVTKLEIGCGRMQNRMIVFEDGKKACARYRQNTDQIQGELFSFYLGQLLNLTNLAPSAASVIDLRSHTWQSASRDIENAQWKSLKPVVLTKWLPDLESAGIPKPFQPLERHLNKMDIQNISLDLDLPKPQKGLLDRLMPVRNESIQPVVVPTVLSDAALTRFIELAQWSDLIVFDYLIANLDRVVNNLYNFQWNADIMAAPAHNLAKQINSELLVFLDNESGLLHGYRLLKKYEAYHGLLLDNLCIFRRPTIQALQRLRQNGVGNELQNVFERTTISGVRDVLPSLPEKSIKILNDRIDRVLGQVQKCQEVFSRKNENWKIAEGVVIATQHFFV
ncbi:Extracellular serine/threonine protein kinase four-jointed, partial [Pseudolycoriella hygida]